MSETLSQQFPNLLLSEFSIEDVHTIKNELTYSYSFKVPYYLVDASSMKLLKIPWADILDTRRSLSSEDRDIDYLYRFPTDTVWEDIEIVLPAGYEPMDLEETLSLSSEVADYQVDMSYDQGVIKASRRIVNKKSIITPDKYPAFREYYNKAVRADERQILLRKAR